jgi:hypothetical protein
MQLAKAIPILKETAAYLAKGKSDFGGQRTSAVRDLGQAIQQLEVALKYEKSNESPKKK